MYLKISHILLKITSLQFLSIFVAIIFSLTMRDSLSAFTSLGANYATIVTGKLFLFYIDATNLRAFCLFLKNGLKVFISLSFLFRQ